MYEFMLRVFGGDLPHEPLALYQVAARAVVVFIAGVGIVRIGKSWIIGRLSTLDVIVGFIIGSLLGRGITGDVAVSTTLTACAAIVATHWVFTALACRSHFLGVLLKGNPRLLIDDGKVNVPNMLRSHISKHDLLEEMHLHGLEDLSQVKRAYKERNGGISIIPL